MTLTIEKWSRSGLFNVSNLTEATLLGSDFYTSSESSCTMSDGSRTAGYNPGSTVIKCNETATLHTNLA